MRPRGSAGGRNFPQEETPTGGNGPRAVSKTGSGRFGGMKTRDSCLWGRQRSACPENKNVPSPTAAHIGMQPPWCLAWGTSVEVPHLEQGRGLGSSPGCSSAVPQIPAQNNTPHSFTVIVTWGQCGLYNKLLLVPNPGRRTSYRLVVFRIYDFFFH